MRLLSYLLSGYMPCIVILYAFNKLYKVNKQPILLIGIPLSLFLSFELFYIPTFFRTFYMIIYLMLVSKLLYKKTLKELLIPSFLILFLSLCSEIIFALLLNILNIPDVGGFSNTNLGLIVSNTIIPLILFVLINLPSLNKLYYKLYASIKYIDIWLLFRLILSFAAINFLFYAFYYQYYSNKILIFYVVILLFVMYTIIIFRLINSEVSNGKMRNKYSISLQNIKEYEEMVNQYRISSHENKNQLLLIRNMDCSEETKKYIDKIIDNKEKDDKDVYNKIKTIPSDSLRAVLYSKLLLMKNKKIKCNLLIERKVLSKDFTNIDQDSMLDICNIINVFIDNAIEAQNDLKNKVILIEINRKDDDLEVVISNEYVNNVDLKRINDTGYTTKGNGHGYGLALVQDTVKKNHRLSNLTECNNNVFSQYLYVKTKM